MFKPILIFLSIALLFSFSSILQIEKIEVLGSWVYSESTANGHVFKKKKSIYYKKRGIELRENGRGLIRQKYRCESPTVEYFNYPIKWQVLQNNLVIDYNEVYGSDTYDIHLNYKIINVSEKKMTLNLTAGDTIIIKDNEPYIEQDKILRKEDH